LRVTRFAGGAFDVLDYAAAFVEVRQYPRAAYLCELRRLGLNSLLRLVFEVRQMQVFKDQLRDLVYVNFGLVILLARLVAALPLPAPLPLLPFAGNHVADLGVAVARPDVFLLAVIEPELVFVERADRHFNQTLAVGKNY